MLAKAGLMPAPEKKGKDGNAHGMAWHERRVRTRFCAAAHSGGLPHVTPRTRKKRDKAAVGLGALHRLQERLHRVPGHVLDHAKVQAGVAVLLLSVVLLLVFVRAAHGIEGRATHAAHAHAHGHAAHAAVDKLPQRPDGDGVRVLLILLLRVVPRRRGRGGRRRGPGARVGGATGLPVHKDAAQRVSLRVGRGAASEGARVEGRGWGKGGVRLRGAVRRRAQT